MLSDGSFGRMFQTFKAPFENEIGFHNRLLIKIDRFDRSPNELTALLAHELQHANEVASDPEITNLASFQRSFASHGWKHAVGFETEEARKISKRVARELSRLEVNAHPKQK